MLCEVYTLRLAILGRLYPQRHVRAKFPGFKVVALIGVRAVNTKKIDLPFVNRHRVSTEPVRPTCRELDFQSTISIQRPVLYLNPPEFTLPVCDQIEWRMLRVWHADRESLLEQIQLSLQDPQIPFAFGVMRQHSLPVPVPIRAETTGFHGIAISTTC